MMSFESKEDDLILGNLYESAYSLVDPDVLAHLPSNLSLRAQWTERGNYQLIMIDENEAIKYQTPVFGTNNHKVFHWDPQKERLLVFDNFEGSFFCNTDWGESNELFKGADILNVIPVETGFIVEAKINLANGFSLYEVSNEQVREIFSNTKALRSAFDVSFDGKLLAYINPKNKAISLQEQDTKDYKTLDMSKITVNFEPLSLALHKTENSLVVLGKSGDKLCLLYNNKIIHLDIEYNSEEKYKIRLNGADYNLELITKNDQVSSVTALNLLTLFAEQITKEVFKKTKENTEQNEKTI